MARTFAVWKLKEMAVERVSSVRVRGIAPYAIDRVEGEVRVRVGLSLLHKRVPCKAYDLLLPNGRCLRFARLADAKAHIRDAVAVGAAR